MAGNTHELRTTGIRTIVERVRPRTAAGVRTAGGVLAAGAVCLVAVVRLLLNASLGHSPPGIQAAHAAASTAAVLLPGGVAIAVGVVTDTDWSRVGLVGAGVFSLLAAVTPAARLPAVGVLPVAALLVTVPALVNAERVVGRRSLFAGLLVLAVTISLGASAGVFASGGRALGTTVTLLTLVVAPAEVGTSTRALVGGCTAAAGVVAGAVAAPFVTGAVFLAVGAAIDPNVLVAAAGVGGGVAVVAEGARRHRTSVVVGGMLLLAAGVPATVPRALAVVLGAYLLLSSTWAPGSGTASGGEPS